jgi:MoxR-like ATPase
MTAVRTLAEGLISNVEKVIVGKTESIRLVVIGLICQGHVLIEDVPGVGKTMLAKSLARVSSDAASTGSITPTCFKRRHRGFDLQPEDRRIRVPPRADHGAGRAHRRDQPGDPKTQAALLEAMRRGR